MSYKLMMFKAGFEDLPLEDAEDKKHFCRLLRMPAK